MVYMGNIKLESSGYIGAVNYKFTLTHKVIIISILKFTIELLN